MYNSFIDFKYVNLILRKENNIGELAYKFGDLGWNWIKFRDLGSKGKIL